MANGALKDFVIENITVRSRHFCVFGIPISTAWPQEGLVPQLARDHGVQPPFSMLPGTFAETPAKSGSTRKFILLFRAQLMP